MKQTRSFERWTRNEDIRIVVGRIVDQTPMPTIARSINRTTGSCQLRYKFLLKEIKYPSRRTRELVKRYREGI